LLDFLSGLGRRWNISLFHYRNHGAAYGRVLLGLQAEPDERAAVHAALRALGCPFWEETANPAYQLFAGTSG
jgi:threonine dehydratase